MKKWNITFSGPLYSETKFRDTKDPCPVYDGRIWHIYGSGGNILTETWAVLHATAPHYTGPWKEKDPIILPNIQGKSVAAPGVIYDEGKFHMFIQTDCFALDGRIEYLVSENGDDFTHINTSLHATQVTRPSGEHTYTDKEIADLMKFPEAGIYDSHPSIIKGEKYIVYSGMAEIGRPNIYLAKSITNTWEGPWKRIRPFTNRASIVAHEDIIHHNQPDYHDYEWGLEGAQLIELPNGLILLNAVCFLPVGERGTRQRIFFAAAHEVTGPYVTIGPLMNPSIKGWDSGENGHAAGIIYDKKLLLFYQARPPHTQPWRFGLAAIDIHKLQRYIESYVKVNAKLSSFEVLAG